jgi:integrase
MADTKRVRYLKIDRGRFFYQRRVPKELQADLRERMWLRPCGDVTYSKAVQMVVTWAEEHDDLIADLENPAKRLVARAKVTRAVKQQMRDTYAELGLPRFFEMTETLPGEKQLYSLERLPRPWQAAAKMLTDAEMARRGNINSPWLIHRIEERVAAIREGFVLDDVFTVPGFRDVEEYLATQLDAETRAAIKVVVTARPPPIDDSDYLDRIKEAFQIGFGPNVMPPEDSDQRDEFEFVKRKLERKIAELSPAPDTISHVLERYCDFNGIRPATRAKYRRDVGRLIAFIGDVPVKHIRAEDLRNLRNQLLPSMQATSVHATFTPIKGMLRHAVDEQIIDINPMSGVKLPKEKRSVEERKWKKFDPDEMNVLNAIDQLWGKPVRGLDDKRRVAIAMLVRVLAFTAMRPAEVMRLTPHDVRERSIHVHGSKTDGSDRIIPLHRALSDFPAWIASGDMSVFDSIVGDKVEPLRFNFGRLIHDKIKPPINDPQKVLYSLRSTFSNAMRRAGAPLDVRRQVLGHVQAGAIRHYDDGPEFETLYRWVNKTDPRIPYTGRPDLDADDDEHGD